MLWNLVMKTGPRRVVGVYSLGTHSTVILFLAGNMGSVKRNQKGDLWQVDTSHQRPGMDEEALPAMLAWMVAPEFTSDAAIRFKIGRRATE
jgi:hypothetical protein